MKKIRTHQRCLYSTTRLGQGDTCDPVYSENIFCHILLHLTLRFWVSTLGSTPMPFSEDFAKQGVHLVSERKNDHKISMETVHVPLMFF